MPRKEKKYHYLYKTTCLVTGRWYIGMHSTSNLEDGYMGSGKRLRYSIRKYGKENHHKEVLEFFETRELLIEAEIKSITPEMIIDKNCMNLKEGGYGGGGFWSEEHMIKCSKGGVNARTLKMKNDEEFRNKIQGLCRKNIEKARKSGKAILKGDKNPYQNWAGKKHSDETKLKMSKSKKVTSKGESNSQYSSMWITNEVDNKKISKSEVIPNGWRKGRLVKSSIDKTLLNEIKEKYDSGVNYSELSRMFEISRNTIRGNLIKFRGII